MLTQCLRIIHNIWRCLRETLFPETLFRLNVRVSYKNENLSQWLPVKYLSVTLYNMICRKQSAGFVKTPLSSYPPVQLLKSTDLGRHSLLYLKEIGNGWFGKVSPLLTGITESLVTSVSPCCDPSYLQRLGL